MRRPDPPSHRAALKNARHGRAAELTARLAETPTSKAALLQDALELTQRHADLDLLMTVLEHADTADLRADALAAVLNLADESRPGFARLVDTLREGERTLVLGSLIEATRLDPDPGCRLLRLKKLLKVIPKDSRPFYWPEAEALAELGGDDAQLTLVGLASEFPEPPHPITLSTLRRAVRKVSNPSKRSTAFVALADITELSLEDIRDAKVSAARIPDEVLRIMTLTRLTQLERRDSG